MIPKKVPPDLNETNRLIVEVYADKFFCLLEPFFKVLPSDEYMKRMHFRREEERKEVLAGKSKRTKAEIMGSKEVKNYPELSPPRDGMQFARLAIMDLEKIREDDLEREEALEHVKLGIINHQKGKGMDGSVDQPREKIPVTKK